MESTTMDSIDGDAIENSNVAHTCHYSSANGSNMGYDHPAGHSFAKDHAPEGDICAPTNFAFAHQVPDHQTPSDYVYVSYVANDHVVDQDTPDCFPAAGDVIDQGKPDTYMAIDNVPGECKTDVPHLRATSSYGKLTLICPAPNLCRMPTLTFSETLPW